MTITGQFIDNSTSEAIPGVSVLLMTAYGDQITGTAADNQGRFTLTDNSIYPGSDVLLSISDISYEPVSINADYLFNNPIVKLNKEYDQLQPVVVTATPAKKSNLWIWLLVGTGAFLLLNKN